MAGMLSYLATTRPNHSIKLIELLGQQDLVFEPIEKLNYLSTVYSATIFQGLVILSKTVGNQSSKS